MLTRKIGLFSLFCRRLRSRGGSVLILVLWTIGSLSLLAAALGSRCVSVLTLTERLEHQLQARYIAWAGIQQAFQALERDSTPTTDGLNESWMDQRALFYQHPVGDGSFTIYAMRQDPATNQLKEVYGFLDEERKINLNTASADLLKNLLQQAGNLKEEGIATIVDSILDWRDEDKDKRPYGAENFYYLGLDDPYECKDGKFENVEELLFVRGVTPELFSWVAPYVTVHGSGRININTADKVVLKALGLSQPGVEGIVFYRAGEDNIQGTMDDRVLPATSSIPLELAPYCPQEDLNRLVELDNEQLLTVSSTEFEVVVRAHVLEDEKNQVHIRCVIDRTGQIKAWTEE